MNTPNTLTMVPHSTTTTTTTNIITTTTVTITTTRPAKSPATFFSLPPELRHAILFQTLGVELPTPKVRKPNCELGLDPRGPALKLSYFIGAFHVYSVYRHDSAKVLKKIDPWIKVLGQVHPDLEDDVRYIRGKWIKMAKAQVKWGKAMMIDLQHW